MNIKNSTDKIVGGVKGTISSGIGKLTPKKKDELKENILSDEEIANLPMAELLNTTVEFLSESDLFRINIMAKKFLKKLFKDGYKYVCSIKAADEVATKFYDRLLEELKDDKKKFKCNNEKRIGGNSYWHYFVRCRQRKIDEFREFAFDLS